MGRKLRVGDPVPSRYGAGGTVGEIEVPLEEPGPPVLTGADWREACHEAVLRLDSDAKAVRQAAVLPGADTVALVQRAEELRATAAIVRRWSGEQ